MLEDRGWVFAKLLEAAAEAQGGGGARAQRVAQLRLEVWQPAIAKRLRRTDHSGVARIEARRDLHGREEHDLLAMLREERRDAVLGRRQVGSCRGDALVEAGLAGGRHVHGVFGSPTD